MTAVLSNSFRQPRPSAAKGTIELPGRAAGGNYLHSARPRVLVLNASFEPLTAVSRRRAVVLVISGRAVQVHDDPRGITVHSERHQVSVPTVVRLTAYVHVPYRAAAAMTRTALMHRDDYRCGYCGARADTIDHVIPRSRGGSHSWDNCVACCRKCNHKKADHLMEEIGWKLRVPLGVPRGRYWRLTSSLREIHPTWRPYLGMQDTAA